MPTLRTLIIAAILFVILTIYSVHSEAQPPGHPKVAVKVQPWQGKGKKPHQKDVISMKDNEDGTVSIYIIACGDMVEIRADREAINEQDPEILEAAQIVLDNSCADAR